MFKRINFLLLLIFFLGFVLRFWNLGNIPSGFDADEAAFGYNSYSILKTGADEYGKILPLTLKSFGKYKPALYSYLAIPFVYFFGLTPFAVRLPSAIFGSLTVVLFYFFISNLFKDKKLAFFASFILAISPWHINLSRTVSEVVVSIFFVLLMLYSLNVFTKENKNKWFIVSFICAILSVLSYTASRIFIPMLLLIFLFSFQKKDNFSKIKKKYFVFFAVIIFFVAAYTLLDSASRIRQINIFEHPQTKLVLEEQIRENGSIPAIVTRVFHNKVINYSRTAFENYQKYFTLDYFFLNGGLPQRMKIPDSGLVFFWQLPFVLLGFYLAFRKKIPEVMLMILWWLVLLIPVSLTFDEVPNVYRSAIIIFPISLLSSFGLVSFFEGKIPFIKKVLIAFLIIFAFWELSYYLLQYYVRQENHKPWYRGYAFKELVGEIGKQYPRYRKIVITKAHPSPYIYLLFYSQFDPNKYQNMGSPKDIGGFDKFVFIPYDCPLSSEYNSEGELNGEKNVLYVNSGACPIPAKNVKVVRIVKWKDGSSAFNMMEYFPPNK